MSGSRWRRPAPIMTTSRGAPSGMSAMTKMMEADDTPPFAPPFLKAGKLVIGQTANILLYLGSRHGLAPKAEAGKTVGASVAAHHHGFRGGSSRHPSSARSCRCITRTSGPPQKSAREEFWNERVPKYLGYFEAAGERCRRHLYHRPARHLCRPVAVPDRGRAALRVSQTHEKIRARDSEAGGAARPRRGAAEHQGVSRKRPPHRLQRGRHLPALQGAGC